MDLILLGTGSPPPSPDNSGHANAIVVKEKMYLLDAGRNVVRQITSSGFNVKDVDTLFFTHFHSDHFTGFADFYITRWLFGATHPLTVYGPGPVREIVDRMQHYYEYDIEIRANEGKPREGLGIEVIEFSPGDSLKNEDFLLRVDKCTVHGNVDDILSYSFESEGRKIVIASDGRPNEKLIPFAENADVLMMHPCLPKKIIEMLGQTENMANIIAGHHASTSEIGKTAAKANVAKIVLSHVTPPMAPSEEIKQEIAKNFDGEIIVGKDLMRI